MLMTRSMWFSIPEGGCCGAGLHLKLTNRRTSALISSSKCPEQPDGLRWETPAGWSADSVRTLVGPELGDDGGEHKGEQCRG